MRSGITRVARRASNGLRTHTATIRRATIGTGLDRGHPDWSSSTVIGSTTGTLQPASTTAQEAAGLTVAAGRVSVYLSPHAFAIEPLTHRILIDGGTYTVLSVERWPSHTHCVCERAQ